MRHLLKQARCKKGLTVSEIAEMVEISESFYYKIESGLRNPTMETAKRIADTLDQTVDELFFDENMDELSNIG